MSAPLSDPTSPSPQIKLQYSGGAKVDSATQGIETLSATSFSELCRDYLTTPQVVGITREKYWGLPKRERGEYKKAPFITAGVFTETGRRNKGSITHCQLVTIDVDVFAEAKPLAVSGAIASLIPWNFCAYHTLSSTPEDPRIRIVVDVETFPKEFYLQAVHYVCDLLGIATRNTETRGCFTPMYRPSVFKGTEGDPRIGARTDGTPLPFEDFSDYVIQGELVPPPEGIFMSSPGKPPAQGFTPEVVKEMLGFLDADMLYPEWIKVAFGLRHQYCQTTWEDAEIGFNLWNEWSEGGEKYPGAEEMRKKWGQLPANPTAGTKAATLYSIRYLAEKAGWEPTPDPEEGLERFKQAIQGASSFSPLMDTLLKEIALSEGLGDARTSTLLQEVQAKLKKLGHKMGIADLKKEVTRFRREAAREASAYADLPSPLSGWVFVASRNKMVQIVAPRSGIDVPAFNMLLTDQLECLENNDDPTMTPATLARDHPDFPKVNRAEYAPELPDDRIYTDSDDGARVLNTYRDTRPPMDEARSEEAGKILLDHTRRMFPDERNVRILLSWLRYMVRYPGCKIKWGVFIQGAQGCGKSFYADLMMAVLGASNVSFVDRSMLESKFNGWMFGAQLLTLDEIMVGEDLKKLMDTLKPFMTQDRLPCSEKYQDALPNVRNRANALLLSNYEGGININDGDRRYFVLKSALQTREQVKALPEDYFSILFSLTTELAGAARHFLHHYEPDPEFKPAGTAPVNADRSQVVEASLNTTQFAVKNLIDLRNYPLIQADLIVFDVLFEAVRSSVGHSLSAKALANDLKALGFTKSPGQPSFGGTRHYIYSSEAFSDPILDRGPEEVARERFIDSQAVGFPGE